MITMPSYDMLPTDCVIPMANELGALVNDIQNYGDMAIEKWRQ